MKTEVIEGDKYEIEDDRSSLETHEWPSGDLPKILKKDLDKYLLSNVKTTTDKNGTPVEMELTSLEFGTKTLGQFKP